jgi:hypothetical protein
MNTRITRVVVTSLFAVIFTVGGGFINTHSAQAQTSPVLSVTGIAPIANSSGTVGYATADGSFDNGWRWVFYVTVPANETVLNMKFDNWTSGSNTIPAASNIAFYSAQSQNASSSASAITINSSGTYSAPMYLNPNVTLGNPPAGEKYVQVTVETAVPVGSAGGSYSTSYGIQTNPNTTAPVITLLGTSTVTIPAGSTYTDAGATAYDNTDGNITSNIELTGTVVTSTLGAQTLTYNVSDPSTSLAATPVTRTVTVTPSDVSKLTTAQASAQTLITANANESTTPGDHVVGSLATLSSALADANATDASAQSVVDGQISALNDAITAYNVAIVGNSGISALTTEIGVAQTAVANAVVGDAPGQYTQASVNTLNAAITAAQGVTNTQAQSVVDAAVAPLTSAVSAFQPVGLSDLTAYDTALAAVTLTNYTTASWAFYQGVVSANVVTNQDSQTAVNTATAAIITAQGSLVTVEAATLASAQTTALATLSTAYAPYVGSNVKYTAANFLTLRGFDTAGIAAINAATTVDAVNSALSTATTGMAGVQTINQ